MTSSERLVGEDVVRLTASVVVVSPSCIVSLAPQTSSGCGLREGNEWAVGSASPADRDETGSFGVWPVR